jgi:hypothetical protein
MNYTPIRAGCVKERLTLESQPFFFRHPSGLVLYLVTRLQPVAPGLSWQPRLI